MLNKKRELLIRANLEQHKDINDKYRYADTTVELISVNTLAYCISQYK